MSPAWLTRLAEFCGPPRGVDALLHSWLADDHTAAAAWANFESRSDLDHLPGPEMCLVGLVAQRLSTIAPTSKLRGRIGGIERANWSRAQLAIREAATAFHWLTRHDIPVMLVGSATWCVRGDTLGRGRRIERVDCCVRSVDIPAAHDLLISAGWTFAKIPGRSGDQDRSAHACRMVRGPFGVLDVRRSPFPHPIPAAAAAESVWQRAEVGALGDASILLPSATDALAITIAEGLRRSCLTGLWLVDVALAASDNIDWPRFEEESSRHGLDAAAFYSLHYVTDRLGRSVPAATLDRLAQSAAGHALRTAIALAEYRCGAQGTSVSRVLARLLQKLQSLRPQVGRDCRPLNRSQA